MENKKTEITQEVDIIHAEDGYHLALVEHDDNTGMSLFQCPKCNRYVVAGEYIPEQQASSAPAANTTALPESQEPPSDQSLQPAKDRRQRRK